MKNAMERFVCMMHEIFTRLVDNPTGVSEIGIMEVPRFAEPGTVVTFEVWVGPTHNSASIIMEAEVVAKGIKVVPKNIVQITNMTAFTNAHWIDLFNTLINPSTGRGTHLREFTISWKLYDQIIADPTAWLIDVLVRNKKEYM